MRIAALLAGAAIALVLPSPSRAAALECAKPKGPYAKAICADPALRQLDTDLAGAYAKLAEGASAAGKALIQRDAHDRHAYIDELCTPTGKDCLTQAYQVGQEVVGRFASSANEMGMIPIEQFRLRPAPAAKGPRRPASQTSTVIAYPRLDHPQEPWAGDFEKRGRQTAEALLPDDPDVDATVDYQATYLAPDLAAVAFSVWLYPHDAVHDYGYSVAFNYLPAVNRDLRASDLFQSGTTWSGFLSERAFEALQAQSKAGNWTLQISGPGELEKPVAAPENWMIRPAGLGLYFAPSTISGYAQGDHEVLIPWADLKPYLLAKPAFAIPSTEAAAPPSPSRP